MRTLFLVSLALLASATPGVAKEHDDVKNQPVSVADFDSQQAVDALFKGHPVCRDLSPDSDLQQCKVVYSSNDFTQMVHIFYAIQKGERVDHRQKVNDAILDLATSIVCGDKCH